MKGLTCGWRGQNGGDQLGRELLLASTRTQLEERRAACFTGVEVSWLSWLTTPTLLFSEAERGPNPAT